MNPMPMLGPIEVFVLMFSSLVGLPPGDRDEALVRCAPKDAIVYYEWSQRGSGKANGPGIDGLAADPEVRRFFEDVEHAALAFVEDQSSAGNESAKTVGKNVPTLVRALLMRPGCFYGTFDASVAQKAADKGPGPPWLAISSGINGAPVINGGDRTEAIDQALRSLVSLLPNPPTNTELKRLSLHLPGFERPLILHRQGNYFIAAIDNVLVDQAVAALNGKSKGLLENTRFVEANKRVSGERTASVSWLDVKSTLAGVVTVLGPVGSFVDQIAKLIGAGEIDSAIGSTHVVNGQIHSSYWIETGAKMPGILSLAGGRGLKSSDFAHVPADADLVVALSLDAAKVFDQFERIVGGTSLAGGQQLQEGIKQLEDRLGFRLKDDLFKAFGNVWTLYDSPAEGGLFATSLVAGLEIGDAAKAKLVFERFKKQLADSLPGRRGSVRRSAVQLEEKTFLGQTIYFVNSIGDDNVMAPAFCLTGTHLLAALHPQAIKAHLRFMQEKHAPLTLQSGASGLRDDGATFLYTTFNVKRFVGLLYPFAPYFGQRVASRLQEKGVPIDVFSIPSARAILPYLGHSTCRATRMEQGILVETESALPLTSAGMLLAVPAMIGITGR